MIESKFLGDGSGCKCRRRSTLGTRVADHTKLPPDLLAANAPSSQFSHAPLPLSTLLPPASVSSSYNLKRPFRTRHGPLKCLEMDRSYE